MGCGEPILVGLHSFFVACCPRTTSLDHRPIKSTSRKIYQPGIPSSPSPLTECALQTDTLDQAQPLGTLKPKFANAQLGQNWNHHAPGFEAQPHVQNAALDQCVCVCAMVKKGCQALCATHGLCICQTNYISLHGSVFDKMYTSTSRPWFRTYFPGDPPPVCV